MENEKYKPASDIEWEQRTLCSDESCIGVIGPDGRCKECGLPYVGDKHQNVSEEPAAVEPEAAEYLVAYGEDDEDDTDEEGDGVTDIEWEQRTLCTDESCIGVIGPDGRCKECGLVYGNKIVLRFYETPAGMPAGAQ